MRRVISLIVWLLTTTLVEASEPNGVVLLYHRVASDGAASTRVTPERFERHLDLIEQYGFTVVPLTALLDGIYHGRDLPSKAVVITFDDAWRSIGREAYPRLAARNMPFSVFVTTQPVDAGVSAYLGWDDMAAMAESGLATFGAHSLNHPHLESLPLNSPVRGEEVFGSVARVREMLGSSAIAAYAYPYGEYGIDTEAMLRSRNLYGLAQQSGAIGMNTPTTRLPRFPFYIGADTDERLLTALTSKPLSVRESTNQVVYRQGALPDRAWQFIVTSDDHRPETLACYSSTGERLPLTAQGDRKTVLLPEFTPGRNKVNCTARATNDAGYFWYSRLWLIGAATDER